VAYGASTTVLEIGFADELAQGSRYVDLGREWRAESDPQQRNRLRKLKTAEADWFVASVNAIAATGELVAHDAGGSRIAGLAYLGNRVAVVAGTNKIVDNLDDARERVREHAFPGEDARMKGLGFPGTAWGRWLIWQADRPGRTTVILVREVLGY
jgi:hypothetical protein